MGGEIQASVSGNSRKLRGKTMPLTNEFKQVFSEVIKRQDANLSYLHDCLIKFKNKGMDQDSMMNSLEQLRNECTEDEEDIILDLMDLVVGFCSPNLSIFIHGS